MAFKGRVLIADNDAGYRDTLAEYLRGAGYEVVEADSPTRARYILGEGMVDVAILDVRMRDDSDPLDRSGLELALNVTSEIPKIILTSFPTLHDVRKILRENVRKGRQVVDYLERPLNSAVPQEAGREAILVAVREALALRRERQLEHQRQELLELTEEIRANCRERRQQARLNHRFALLVFGIIVLMFLGTFFGWLLGYIPMGVAAAFTVGDVLFAGIGGILWKILQEANVWMEECEKRLSDLQKRIARKT